jgi:single-strand DNA-binding protein
LHFATLIPFKKGTNPMNVNRVTLAGSTGKDARNSSTQNGKSMTKLSVATTKRYKDAECNWQEKTQWHNCIAYGPAADYAARIQTGDHVFLEGELIYREYERTVETDSGPIKVQWPVTEATVPYCASSSNRASEVSNHASVPSAVWPGVRTIRVQGLRH